VLVIFSVVAAIVSVRLTFAVCVDELESVTVNANAVAFAVAVGVPLITPVDAFNVRPPGKVPEVNVQAYGVVPPLAVSV
jgi:hypothetical protein